MLEPDPGHRVPSCAEANLRPWHPAAGDDPRLMSPVQVWEAGGQGAGCCFSQRYLRIIRMRGRAR